MTIRFIVDRHSVRDGDVVQVLKDGVLCAVIYPDDGVSDIKIVSAHFAGELAKGDAFPTGVRMENGGEPPIPCVRITFDPHPYTIAPSGIVRE